MWPQYKSNRGRGKSFTFTMNLFQHVLAPVIFRGDQRAVRNYYFANSLLDPQLLCPTCFADMKLVPRPKLSDGYAWHCKQYLCGSRSYHSVRTGSFFAKTHVPLHKYLHLLYLWAQNSPVQVAADTLGVSRQCVQQHFLFLREVCSTHLMNHPVSLGGANVIVQIDESLFRHKPKYHRGRAPAADQWVFGIVDTSTTPGVGYMELVPDRRAVTLIPIIQRVVLPGSIIHSDQWAAYQPLVHHRNYHFQTVNHSQNWRPHTVYRKLLGKGQTQI